MSALMIRTLMILMVCTLPAGAVRAWEMEEHRLLGDSVYCSVMRQCAAPLNDTAFIIGGGADGFKLGFILDGEHSFGEMCAIAAADDYARSRFHERGKTVLEQLGSLSAEQISKAWHESSATGVADSIVAGFTAEARQLAAPNVVSAYLLHHLMSLRAAGESHRADQADRAILISALAWEAAAQGYLADAFSASHLLVPRSGPFAWLQRRNHIEAHNYHRNQGVYVMNSNGEVWQTFGDKLLHWYSPACQAVHDACRSSLMEVLAVFFHAHGYNSPEGMRQWQDSLPMSRSLPELISGWPSSVSGADYYAELRLPTLLLIPMPIAATWSHRTERRDQHGIRIRRHYPQMKEQNLHDPDAAEIDEEFLYSRSAFPDWLMPPPFRHDPPVDPDSLITQDPDWASVRWIQNRYAPPSYKGALMRFGGKISFDNGKTSKGGLIGLGYGLWDDLVLLQNVSVDFAVQWHVDSPRQPLLVSSVGGGITAGSGWLKAVRFEAGLSLGLSSDYDDLGTMLALGMDSRVQPLRFTNAGISWRIRYQWLHLERLSHGPILELIIH